MEVSEIRNEIIERINEIEDEKQLLQIEKIIEDLLSNNQPDFWVELPDHVKRDSEEAEKELEQGLGIPHEQAMREIRSKYNIT